MKKFLFMVFVFVLLFPEIKVNAQIQQPFVIETKRDSANLEPFVKRCLDVFDSLAQRKPSYVGQSFDQYALLDIMYVSTSTPAFYEVEKDEYFPEGKMWTFEKFDSRQIQGLASTDGWFYFIDSTATLHSDTSIVLAEKCMKMSDLEPFPVKTEFWVDYLFNLKMERRSFNEIMDEFPVNKTMHARYFVGLLFYEFLSDLYGEEFAEKILHEKSFRVLRLLKRMTKQQIHFPSRIVEFIEHGRPSKYVYPSKRKLFFVGKTQLLKDLIYLNRNKNHFQCTWL